MAKLIIKDRKGELEKIARKLINHSKYKKDFQVLPSLRFLFTWRLGDTPEYDKEGQALAATTHKLSTRERDVYRKDVEIRVFKDSWRKRGKRAKKRLMWHELYHIDVEQGENFKVNRDDDGRVIFELRKHDVRVNTFEKEVKLFGISANDVSDAVVLSKALKKRKKKKDKN